MAVDTQGFQCLKAGPQQGSAVGCPYNSLAHGIDKSPVIISAGEVKRQWGYGNGKINRGTHRIAKAKIRFIFSGKCWTRHFAIVENLKRQKIPSILWLNQDHRVHCSKLIAWNTLELVCQNDTAQHQGKFSFPFWSDFTSKVSTWQAPVVN